METKEGRAVKDRADPAFRKKDDADRDNGLRIIKEREQRVVNIGESKAKKRKKRKSSEA